MHEFLDEDGSRQNSKHLGVPVKKPTPGLQNVIIPLDSDLQKNGQEKVRILSMSAISWQLTWFKLVKGKNKEEYLDLLNLR